MADGRSTPDDAAFLLVARSDPAPQAETTAVRVVFFTDMKGSTALKQDMAEKWDENAYQRLRRQHDALLTEVITRGGPGEIIKSMGDGFLAVFHTPSTAVERALETFEPYNANIAAPMERLAGEQIAPAPEPGREAGGEPKPRAPQVRIIRSWEHVARDGREFAERGAGMMYWFKVPLGGIAYPEGFRNFLQPALLNPRITKIRFVLDSTNATVRRLWYDNVLPLIQIWASRESRSIKLEQQDDDCGRLLDAGPPPKALAWIFADLSMEFTPCFKLLVPDLDTDDATESEAQVFLSTASRAVRSKDGTLSSVRIPDAILRVRASEDDSLLYALNTVANQWGSLFT